MSKLTGKVAIVTGSSRGIGRAIAMDFAKEGANIVINYSRDQEGANETLELVKKVGSTGILVKEDVSNFEGA